MRRPDEVPVVDVVFNILAGLFAGLALFALGGALRVVDDNRPEL